MWAFEVFIGPAHLCCIITTTITILTSNKKFRCNDGYIHHFFWQDIFIIFSCLPFFFLVFIWNWRSICHNFTKNKKKFHQFKLFWEKMFNGYYYDFKKVWVKWCYLHILLSHENQPCTRIIYNLFRQYHWSLPLYITLLPSNLITSRFIFIFSKGVIIISPTVALMI